MSLQSSICNKLNSLKATTSRLYSSTGEVYEERRNEDGQLYQTKLNKGCLGFVVDHTPDLSISKILPWLYMGSQDVAFDYELLKSHGITHILSLGIKCPCYENIQTYFFEVNDLDDFCIEQIFLECIKIIDAVCNTGIIFVHCNAGISRSTTIVAAYLIQYYKIDHVEALNRIKNVRPKVNPNKGFINKLEKFANNCTNKTMSG